MRKGGEGRGGKGRERDREGREGDRRREREGYYLGQLVWRVWMDKLKSIRSVDIRWMPACTWCANIMVLLITSKYPKLFH